MVQDLGRAVARDSRKISRPALSTFSAPGGKLEGWSSDTDTSVMTSKRCTGWSELRMCRRTAHFQSPLRSRHSAGLETFPQRRRGGERGGGKRCRPSFFNAAIIMREVESTVFRVPAPLNSGRLFAIQNASALCPAWIYSIIKKKKFRCACAHNEIYITRAIYPLPRRLKTACLSKTLKHSSTAKSF